MADTKIASLTAGTLAATDRIPVAISPFASGDNRYLTPLDIKSYITGGANTWTGAQTVTGDILTSTNNTYDLGSTGTRFKNGWFAGNLTVTGGVAVGGSCSGATLDVTGMFTVNTANLRTKAGSYWGFSSASDNSAISDITLTRVSAGVLGVGTGTTTTNGTLRCGTFYLEQTPAAISQATTMTFSSGADSAGNIGHRVSFNLNGTTYWIPCSTTAF